MKFVTFSFDDGEIYDERLCELLRVYSLKASFGLRSNCCDLHGDIYRRDGTFFRHYDTIKAEDIARIYSGFEICSHGANHQSFARKSIEQLKEEIYPDLEFFKKLTGESIVGAIYPGGDYDESAIKNLKKIGIRFCRTIPDGTYSFDIPQEWECWIPTCHFQDEKIFEIIDKFSEIDKNKDAILHIFGHSYELENKDEDWWGIFEKICKCLRLLANVEYASLGEVYDYFQNENDIKET